MKMIAILIFCTKAAANQFGPYTYEIVDQTVTITDFDDSGITGHLEIPSHIDGKPVTAIGGNGFYPANGLTSITVPDTVLTIGDGVFNTLTNVKEINLGQSVQSIGNAAFLGNSFPRINLPENLISIGERAFDHCDLLEITLPPNLVSVGKRAFAANNRLTTATIRGENTTFGFGVFQSCQNLQHITIEGDINPESTLPFYGCFALRSITFESNAPRDILAYTTRDPIFEMTFDPTFSFYFREGSTGFPTPTMAGFPCKMISTSPNAYAESWLRSHGLDPEIDMSKDHNGDGHPLLLSYALGLNPDQNVSQSLPQVSIADNDLQLTYHASAPGIIYTPLTSPDLKSWSPVFNLSRPNESETRTAKDSFPLLFAQRTFLSLSVRMH